MCATLFVLGCSSDGDNDSGAAATSKQTIVLETDTRGEIAVVAVPFTIDCRAFFGQSGRAQPGSQVGVDLGPETDLPGAATVVVLAGPAPPAAIDGNKLTVTRPGTYKVRCEIPGAKLVDDTPAVLPAETGAPVDPQTTVVLTHSGQPVNKVEAGDQVHVRCDGADPFGNIIKESWTITTTAKSLSVAPNVPFLAAKAGTVTFACRAGNKTDPTPAVLHIQTGPPKILTTKVTPDQVPAGHASEVSCTATDAHGNPVDNFPFAISHSDKLALKGLYVTSTVAGLQSVKCVPETIAWKYFTIHGAMLEIFPGPPAKLLVAKVPDKAVYKRNSKVRFVPHVRDEFGNTIAAWPVKMTVSKPAKGFKVLSNTQQDKEVRFSLDNTYEIDFQAESTALSHKTAVLVDGAPPLLTIDYPPWGSTLALKPSIQLNGKAGDKGAGIKDLHVNGIKTFPDGADDWYLQVGARHGLNTVEAIATDLGDQKTRATRGFYYSDKFYPTDAKTPKKHLVKGGLQLFLGQQFFDDGDHNHAQPDDLATIIEIIAGTISMDQLAGGGLSGSGADIKLSNFTMAKPQVQITTHDGGLEVRIVMSDMSVDVAVKAKVKLGPIKTSLKANGTLKIAKIDVSSWLKLGVQQGKVTAEASWTKAKIDGMKLSISGLAGLFNPVFNLILNGIKSDIEQGLEQELSKELPKAFAAIFAALAINDTFELDPLVPGAKGKVTMALASEVASIEMKKVGMIAKLDMGFSAAKQVVHTNLGAIARAGCVGVAPDEFHLDTKAKIQLAAHDDLLNQALYALWYGGAMSGVIDKGVLEGQGVPGLPLETATIKIDPLLPPIIEGCPDPKKSPDPMRIELQMGDAQSSIDLYSNELVRLDVVMHMRAPITLKFGKDDKGQDALIATADPNPLVMHELHGLSKQLEEGKWAWEKTVKTLFDKLFEKGLPGFEKPVVVPLPATEMDLHAVSPQIPKGTTVKVKITNVSRKGGFGAFTMALAP